MKVLLVYPNVLDLARFKEKRKEFPPFGVLYLAAIAERYGYDVSIAAINNGDAMNLRDYDVVGFSIPSSATYNIVKSVRFESVYKDNAVILIGGVHSNFYPIETLSDIKPDVVVFGEGEEAFVEILDAISVGRSLSRVKGLYYFDNGTIAFSGQRQFSKNIDWLPALPARHLLSQDSFIMNNRLSNTDMKMAHVMFSRGCPFPCAFCAAARTRIQYRSGWHARQELSQLKEEYNIDGFAVTDDNFIISPHKVLDVANSIKDLNLKWSALSRVDTFREDLARIIYAAGCIEVKFGVESGSESLLKAMKKNITREQIIATLKLAKSIGINAKVFIIHGYPGENMATTLETISLLEQVKCYIDRISLFRFVPLPGTYVYNNPKEFHLHGTDRDSDWNGDWGKYHIYNNDFHWWGTSDDFIEMDRGYVLLQQYVDSIWPNEFSTD